MQVSIHEVKTNLSRYLETVEAGTEVLISRHKKAVTKIIPLTR